MVITMSIPGVISLPQVQSCSTLKSRARFSNSRACASTQSYKTEKRVSTGLIGFKSIKRCLGLRSTLIRVAIIIPDIKTLFTSLKTLNFPSENKPRGPWPLSPAAQALIREAATCRPHTPAPRRMRLKPRGALAPQRGLRPRGAWASNRNQKPRITLSDFTKTEQVLLQFYQISSTILRQNKGAYQAQLRPQ